MFTQAEHHYDAILIVSFGGPEGMADVMPFLANVLRGKNVPEERLKEVAKHYERFGGVSPINQQVRELIAALKNELRDHGPDLPVYWGNRNWHPMLADTIGEMAKDGVKKALAFVTSAYSSYSGCRQYLDNIEKAKTDAGQEAMVIDKIRLFFNHPLFVNANAARLKDALNRFDPGEVASGQVMVAFTAHSIPESMVTSCEYVTQLRETARLVAAEAGVKRFTLCYQSRSGPPEQPWLTPDICDFIREASEAEAGQARAGQTAENIERVNNLVIAPIGFLSDHMEVIFDLDTAARELCDELSIKMVRAATVGTHPLFIRMIRELIAERIDPAATASVEGELEAWPNSCPPDCCPAPAGRPKPASHPAS